MLPVFRRCRHPPPPRTTRRAGATHSGGNMLLDTGRDCSYVRQEMIIHLSLCCTGVESVAFTAFGSSRLVASQICGIFNVDLFSDITPCVTVNVIEIEQICAPVCSTTIPSCLIEHLSHVPLVTTTVDNNLTIDLL